jgi:hypothetical protein
MSDYIDLDEDMDPVAKAVLRYVRNSFEGLENKIVSNFVEVDESSGRIKVAGKDAVRVGPEQDFRVNFGPGLAVGISSFTDIMSMCCQKKLYDLTEDGANYPEKDWLHMFYGDFEFESGRFALDEPQNVLIVSFADEGDDQRFPGEGDKVYVKARDFVYRAVMCLVMKHLEDLSDPMLE